MRLRHLDGFARGHQSQFLALADHDRFREGEDAREGDMEIGENTDRTRIDDMRAESSEIAGAGGARVDRRGDGVLAREDQRIDADRRSAPIDMRMQIDEARRHDPANDIADIHASGRVDRRTARGNLSAGKGDIADRVELLRRVDHPSAAQDQVVGHAFVIARHWPDSVRESATHRSTRPRRSHDRPDAD